MLLHAISFYSSPNGVFSCFLEGARLGIGRLKLNYNIFLWQLKGVLGGTFVANTGPSSCFTFCPPLFKWCPSFKGPIPFFSLGAPSFSLKSSPKVNKGVCSCYESHHPLGLKIITSLHVFHRSYSSMPCSSFLMEL
jgi:hypothetical protein